MDHARDRRVPGSAFAAALLGAKLLGELAERSASRRCWVSSLVGVLLGPSVLGLVPLSAGVQLVAEIGVILLLFEVGLETDLGELFGVGGPALSVAVAGMICPSQAPTPWPACSVPVADRALRRRRADGHFDRHHGERALRARGSEDARGPDHPRRGDRRRRARSRRSGRRRRSPKRGAVGAGTACGRRPSSIAFLAAAIFLGMPARRATRARRGGERTGRPRRRRGRLRAPARRRGAGGRLRPDRRRVRRGIVLARTNRRHDIDTRFSPRWTCSRPVFFVYVGAQVDVRFLEPTVGREPAGPASRPRAYGRSASSASSWRATAPGARAAKRFIGAGWCHAERSV